MQSNPIEIIKKLAKEEKIITTFETEYIIYVETLNKQVFNNNGYELVAIKKEMEE